VFLVFFLSTLKLGGKQTIFSLDIDILKAAKVFLPPPKMKIHWRRKIFLDERCSKLAFLLLF
jgi:hypothetical protein